MSKNNTYGFNSFLLISLFVHTFFYFYLWYNIIIFILLNVLININLLLLNHVNETLPKNKLLYPYYFVNKYLILIYSLSNNNHVKNNLEIFKNYSIYKISKNYIVFFTNEFNDLLNIIKMLLFTQFKLLFVKVVTEMPITPLELLPALMKSSNTANVITLDDSETDDDEINELCKKNGLKID